MSIFILFDKQQRLKTPSKWRCLIHSIPLIDANSQQFPILAEGNSLNPAFKVKMRNDEISPQVVNDGLPLSIDSN